MNISLPLNDLINSSTVSVSHRDTVLVVVESTVFLILNIGAFVGNLLVCLAIYRNPSLRTVTNNFILSLALTDLLMAVFVMPVYTVSSMLDKWIVGKDFSHVIFWCLNSASFISILNVTLLAINRYFRVVRPQIYSNIYSKKSSAMMAIVTWVVTLVLVGLIYVALGVRYETSELNPTLKKLIILDGGSLIYSMILSILYVIVPIFVISICYVKIYKTIRHHNRAGAPSTQEGNSAYGVAEAKITRLLTAVVIVFCLCWYPGLIITTLDIFNLLPSATTKYLVSMCLFPLFTSSVINPILYGFLNQSFRSEFFKILRLQ